MAMHVVIEEDYCKPFFGHVGQTVLSMSHSHRGARWHYRAVSNGHWRVMPFYYPQILTVLTVR
jgi:hypothetical protein